MTISDVQAGRIGEYLLAVYSMLTTGGELVPFQVDADDDHRDLVVAVKGKNTFASLQAKACFSLGASPPNAPARGGRMVELHFRAHPDREDAFSPFRTQTSDVGPRLLQLINALPPSTKPLPGARLVLTTR
ncbi:MAG TPA: hypothetical protein VLK30_06925 [Candidatus Limnocylindrales bacterium]|nr:hypothetical protein [Candidatus Limnocylindrales bacterium]